MTKALVFGGAFNPPTNAHIALAQSAMEQVDAQHVIFVPSKQRYVLQEQKKDSSFCDEERLSMLHKIAKSRSWMLVSDYEIQQKSQPRTYQTLCHFRQEGYDVSLLMGSDKLEELETGWMYIDEICHEFGIVCLIRSHDDIEAIFAKSTFLQNRRAYITIIPTMDMYQAVSSTKVRSDMSSLRLNPNQPDIIKRLEQSVPSELNGMKEYI